MSFLPELSLVSDFQLSAFKLVKPFEKAGIEPVDFAARGTKFQLSSSQRKSVTHVSRAEFSVLKF